MSSVKKLAVIGAGQMGGGIAQVAASIAKIPSVLLFDVQQHQLEHRMAFIESTLNKDVGKGKMSEADKKQSLERLRPTSTLDDLKDCDFVIEAVPEAESLKTQIFQNLNGILRNDNAIVASNTSSISITKLAAGFKKPSNFVGMHFMNPVPVMKLVELISGKQTSASTLAITRELADMMGKTSTVSADIPGFIVNRLLMPYINEAMFALYEGLATKDDIDKSMILGTNVPMGPLKLADFIGLDTCLMVMKVLHTEFGDSKYRPCPLLVQMVNAGYLGKKTGKGFYDYNANQSKI